MSNTTNMDGAGAAKTGKFMEDANRVVLNQASTDSEIMGLLRGYLSSDGFSEEGLSYFTTLMNMRSQRATALSNLEQNKHQTAMSLISNLK